MNDCKCDLNGTKIKIGKEYKCDKCGGRIKIKDIPTQKETIGEMDSELKRVLIQLIKSHGKLSSAEYQRNTSYNNTHYSHIAEQEMLDYLMSNYPEIIYDELIQEAAGG